MRGGMGWQIMEIFNKSGILQIGKKKHTAKAEAREAGAITWADIGKELKIYSYNTAETYLDIWHQFGDFVKTNMGLKDIENTNENHIKAYLESRIENRIKFSTYQKEASALAKLENALNMYSDEYGRNKKYNFRIQIRACGVVARKELPRNEQHRAYRDPKGIVAIIGRNDQSLAASIQMEAGARIHEVSLIKESQLSGYEKDKITGQDVGRIDIRGKGGKDRTISVSTETYRNLVDAVKQTGQFKIDKTHYRVALRQAAEQTNQKYSGSHGLRWSFAQNRMSTSQEHDNSYEASLRIVSSEMGHDRADITEHYLR